MVKTLSSKSPILNNCEEQSIKTGVFLSFLTGLLFIAVLQRTLKAKIQALSFSILMWYWKRENIVFLTSSEIKMGRGNRCHWKRIVWFSVVYHAWIVLLLAGFLHAFPLQVYKNYGQDLSIWFAPGKKVKSKAGIYLYFCLAEVFHALCQFVHAGETEEQQ